MSGLGISIIGAGYSIISQDHDSVGIYGYVYRRGETIMGLLVGCDNREHGRCLGVYPDTEELRRVLTQIIEHDSGTPFIMPPSTYIGGDDPW